MHIAGDFVFSFAIQSSFLCETFEQSDLDTKVRFAYD